MRDRSGDKGRETVDRILGAAKDVFAKKGFAGARVDEIAERAGVNKAALYYHIGDKKALYAEVIHDVIGSAARRLSAGIEKARTPEDKVRTYIRTLAATFDENPQMPRLMMRELASGGQSLPDVFFEDLFSLLRTLSGIIEEGREQGVFIETLPLIVHFMAIGATVVYKTIIPVLLSARQVPDELKSHGKDLSGLVCREIEKLILKAMRT
ncbi:MAG TPA: TetR/AcrR family transcriptional regulator [Deltaproteobacteria bacterium]|jgi:AcrR family transcriptional regulator|nr:TetR/AcrR family transcriptional regulator [Deltaproteobacteria bacterium]HQI01519.1 TetR/AcrR family transcriptional regulator [Deltaproteobacteria bacterium]HQJ07435.1 TetR/AcrR family transcriptional regulator [Deltaproteobacteria bacterium]